MEYFGSLFVLCNLLVLIPNNNTFANNILSFFLNVAILSRPY